MKANNAKNLIAVWESIDPEENRFRYYSLSLGEDLWGKETLIQRWGRIGERKREAIYWPKNYRDLVKKIKEIASRRKRHGYQLESGSLFYIGGLGDNSP